MACWCGKPGCEGPVLSEVPGQVWVTEVTGVLDDCSDFTYRRYARPSPLVIARHGPREPAKPTEGWGHQCGTCRRLKQAPLIIEVGGGDAE